MSQALLQKVSALELLSEDLLLPLEVPGTHPVVISATRSRPRTRAASRMERTASLNAKQLERPTSENTSRYIMPTMAVPDATAPDGVNTVPLLLSITEECVRSKSVSSCDMMMARCLFEAGFGITMTEYSWKLTGHYNNASYHVFDNHDHRAFLTNPMAALVQEEGASHPRLCTFNNQTYCVWLLRHAVSVHLSARSYTSVPAAAAALVKLLHSHAGVQAVAGLI